MTWSCATGGQASSRGRVCRAGSLTSWPSSMAANHLNRLLVCLAQWMLRSGHSHFLSDTASNTPVGGRPAVSDGEEGCIRLEVGVWSGSVGFRIWGLGQSRSEFVGKGQVKVVHMFTHADPRVWDMCECGMHCRPDSPSTRPQASPTTRFLSLLSKITNVSVCLMCNSEIGPPTAEKIQHILTCADRKESGCTPRKSKDSALQSSERWAPSHEWSFLPREVLGGACCFCACSIGPPRMESGWLLRGMQQAGTHPPSLFNFGILACFGPTVAKN